jgi:hypothetical protein
VGSVEQISFTGDPNLDDVLARRNELAREIYRIRHFVSDTSLDSLRSEVAACEGAIALRRAVLDEKE